METITYDKFQLESWTNYTTSLSQKQDDPLLMITDDHTYIRLIMLSTLLVPILTQILTWVRFERSTQKKGTLSSEPPMLPYTIPFLGHLKQLLWNTNDFINYLGQCAARRGPIRFHLFNHEMYLINDPENISMMFLKGRNNLSAPIVSAVLKRMFGTPDEALRSNEFQDAAMRGVSQDHLRPNPSSSANLSERMQGKSLQRMTRQFAQHLSQEQADLNIGYEWEHRDDICDFLRDITVKSLLKTFCGPLLLEACPSFPQDYADYESKIMRLLLGLPRAVIPSAYRARDRCVNHMRTWHRTLSRKWLESYTRGVQDDEETTVIEAQHQSYARRFDMNEDAISSHLLGVMFAVISNPTLLTFWTLWEVVKDPVLTQRLRQEIRGALLTDSDSSTPEFDIQKLCENPLLQSIYAEAARMYVTMIYVRTPARGDFQLGPWAFRKNKKIVFTSLCAHRNVDTWNTGTEADPHDVDTFYPDRFIVDPQDPSSGPINPAIRAKMIKKFTQQLPEEDAKAAEKDPYFSMEGLGGMWIPYGGGDMLCPGRNFAKKQIMLSLALLITQFDIDILPGATIEPDRRGFSTSTRSPRGEAAFRIRRRDWRTESD